MGLQAPGSPGRGSHDDTMRFLYAEDNPVNCRVLAALLAPLGAELVTVENGREAVEAWDASDFDLIFMDINMPVVDGVTAAREIRAREQRSGREPTPIVAVTSEYEDHKAKIYFAVGINGLVPKPVTPKSLYAAIESALRPRACAEPHVVAA